MLHSRGPEPVRGVNLVHGLWGPHPPTGHAQPEARAAEQRGAMPGTGGESVGANTDAEAVLTRACLAVLT